MSLFSRLFSKTSAFEKSLLSSSIYNASETVDLNDIKSLLQGFPQKLEDNQLVQSMTVIQIFKEFIRLIPLNPNQNTQLKILVTCNVLLGDLKYGKIFVPQFQIWNGWKVAEKEQTTKVKSTAKDLLNRLIHTYQTILQKLAINYELLIKSKLRQNIEVQSKDTSATLTFYFKIVNMLNFVFSQKDIFLLSAEVLPYLVVMEVYLLVWNDIIALFFNLERYMLQFLDCYQQMECKDAMQIFELYKDFITCTDKIKEFFAINQKFSKPSNLKEPRYFCLIYFMKKMVNSQQEVK